MARVGQSFLHAFVGGVSTALSGGKFGHGFVSAGVTKGLGAAFLPTGGDWLQIAYGTVVSALIGGTTSKLVGGKFANGAQTAAMQYVLNQVSRALQRRPSYSEMEKHYPEGTAEQVFEGVGGKVAINGKIPANKGGWENSCAVRASVCLNASGSEVPFMRGETSSGANGKWHIFRVKTLENYLVNQWGVPDVLSTNMSDFTGKKGILIFDTTGTWSDASGHATLWNGQVTIDNSNYFGNSSRVLLWELPN